MQPHREREMFFTNNPMKKRTIKTGIKPKSPRKYVVSELVPVPVVQEVAGQYIHRTEARDNVCNLHSTFTNRHGCYVFGIKTRKGVVPVYVGCTGKRTLGFEAFTSHKRAALAEALACYPDAKLFVAFVISDGTEKESDIKEIESVLIRAARKKNPSIRNETDPSVPQNEKNGIAYDWYIDGVTNGGRGRRSENAQAFRDMLGIE